MSEPDAAQPSDEGKRRYPPNGFYMEADEDYGRDYPCTCRLDCSLTCKGECGCPACHAGYADFLSSE